MRLHADAGNRRHQQPAREIAAGLLQRRGNEAGAVDGNDLSRVCLVAAISAIGMKTHLRELATVGFKPVALMVGETIFLAILALALLRWLA